MFKGLKDKFKYKSGVKYLRQELSRSRPAPKRKSGVNAIAVIVDLDQFDKAEVFFELIDAFGLRPNAIKVIGYRRYYDKNSPYATPVFSDKDLGWNGEIENSYALEFLSREYDILINYFKEENLLMQLMSVRTQARMRIGFAELDPAYNDLIFDCDLADFGLFRKETKKYLEVLNELV
ncbi:hypothetical protein H7F20_15615 [Robiginitalea sp. SC105]|nr:hypothetical protein [Robiginitalea sp. SC105]MBC2840771.1 hypothetical protein [Robiginitalea sp. SC105]